LWADQASAAETGVEISRRPTHLADMPASPAPVSTADARQADIYRRMTPSQRLEQAMQMNRQMRVLMDSGLRATQPQLSADERRQEIARRIRHARG
jgi:hypothetical protein